MLSIFCGQKFSILVHKEKESFPDAEQSMSLFVKEWVTNLVIEIITHSQFSY